MSAGLTKEEQKAVEYWRAVSRQAGRIGNASRELVAIIDRLAARRPHPAAPVASVGVEVQGVVTDTHRNKLTIAIDGNMPDEYQQAAMRGGVRVSVRLADPTEGG